jgi:hypothetical protein
MSGGAGTAGCDLRIDHTRHRKTGPEHPLTVLRCRTHDCAFTLYPPGYAPYRRQPVLQVAPDGRPIRGEGDGKETDFDGTVFEAALDARRRRPWPRASGQGPRDGPCPDPPERWWGTQGRHLTLAARLVGVAHDLSDRVRSFIAAVVSVDTLQLREGACVTGYHHIGEAVCGVLARMKGGARRAWQLLICSHLIGHWGEPLYWDAERQVLERSPLRPPGTAAAR